MKISKKSINRLTALLAGAAILFSAGLAAAEDNNTDSRTTLKSQDRVQLFGAYENDDNFVFANSFQSGGSISQKDLLRRHGR